MELETYSLISPIEMKPWPTSLPAKFVLLSDAQATIAALQQQLAGAQGALEHVSKELRTELRLSADLQAQFTTVTAERDALKRDQELYKFGCTQRAFLEKENDALEAELTTLRTLIGEIKAEFDCGVHQCERCGEADPMTTFDVYRLVEKAATLDAGKEGQGE